MKLLRLTLDNFRAIKHLDFEPEGNNAAVYGKNSTGKTTIYNAFTWLLFGKSATGEKNFSPKTLDHTGQEKHHLQHKVEGVFLLEDDHRLTLTRILSEKHTKKQGTGDVIFKGNSTEYYIDGVPAKEKEYEATVKGICDEERLKILTMPDYFAAVLPWQKRREIMLEAVNSTLTDDDVIDSQECLQPLKNFLLQYGTRYTVDQLLKVAKNEKQKLEKDLKDIPIRIDEAAKAIQRVMYTREDLEQQQEILQQMIAGLEEERQQITIPTAAAENKILLAELQAELADARLKFSQDNPNDYGERIARQKSELSANNIELNRLMGEKTNLEHEEKRLKTEREKTAQEYERVQKEQWSGSDICPTCGQPLPIEKVEAAQKKFNLDKSRRLEQINVHGRERCSKDMIAAVQRQIDEKQQEINEKQFTIMQNESALEVLNNALLHIPRFEDSEIFADIQHRIAEAEAAVRSDNQDIAGRLEQFTIELGKKKTALQELQRQVFVLDNNDMLHLRIQELEAQEQSISDKLEQAEYKISLCDKFIVNKIELLTRQFNSHFQNVRFKLFEQQINGGYSECCEVMVPCEQGGEQMLVPYNLANTSSKMNAGLEIIDTLGKYWGIHLPVFIDNAESYTGLPEIDSQIIQLVVSAADTVLRIEVDNAIKGCLVDKGTMVAAVYEPEQLKCVGMDF